MKSLDVQVAPPPVAPAQPPANDNRRSNRAMWIVVGFIAVIVGLIVVAGASGNDAGDAKTRPKVATTAPACRMPPRAPLTEIADGLTIGGRWAAVRS